MLEFRVGRTNDEPSHARLAVARPRPGTRSTASSRVWPTWARRPWSRDAASRRPRRDGILPDEFYSTTNFETFVRVDGALGAACATQKMDCALVLRDGAPRCVKQGRVRPGEPVRAARRRHPRASAGAEPRLLRVRLHVERHLGGGQQGHRHRRRPRARCGDARARASGSSSCAGPAIVHSGGDAALARLVRAGWIDVVLTGNAFAVHDLEKAILKTSLGVCQMSGRAVEGGSRNHLCAINAVNRAGGVAPGGRVGPGHARA